MPLIVYKGTSSRAQIMPCVLGDKMLTRNRRRPSPRTSPRTSPRKRLRTRKRRTKTRMTRKSSLTLRRHLRKVRQFLTPILCPERYG